MTKIKKEYIVVSSVVVHDLLKALNTLIDPLTGLVYESVARDIGADKAYAIEQAINKALGE